MITRPMPAHASRYLDSQPSRRPMSIRLFGWLLSTRAIRSMLTRLLIAPLVVAMVVAAELADLIDVTFDQLAWHTTDGFWLHAYRIFIAFALTMSIGILALAFYVLVIQ